MCYNDDNQICWWIACGITGIVSVSIFFGLFFGLNYPEIREHGWPASQCTVIWNRLDEYYKCSTDCSYCDTTGSTTSCNSLINLGNSYSPQQCKNDSNKCPPIGES